MRKLLLPLLLLITLIGHTQADTTSQNSAGRASLVNHDSLVKVREFNDSVAKESQKKQDLEMMQRNLDSLMRVQKERDAKQKKAAMIRIGIGVAFLVILVIGLLRRRKKKN
jgi:hypothetical protein